MYVRSRSPEPRDFQLIEDFNPELVHRLALWYLPVIGKYHRAEFLGLENIPDSAFLAAGNHTGVHFMPETMLWLSKYHSDASRRPMYTLVHDFAYKLAKRLRLPLHALGILDAEKNSAFEALCEGCAVTVYPGGDRDNARPFCKRNTIDFFGHTGYVKMALRARVPILPVVGVGGGESVFTLTSGSWLADITGLSRRYKLHTWPIYWSFPFGWHFGHMPALGIPLPTQITISVLEPIPTSIYPDNAASDPEIVGMLNTQVIRAMQREMDRLAEGRIPIIGGRKRK
ncbi:MAG: hypothetical protein K9J06_09985 [Flavobacteriales bacterium]|nr:hypothetical protein [Flavobacteriales bacterium]